MSARGGQDNHSIVATEPLGGFRKGEAELIAATPVVRHVLKPAEPDAHIGPYMMASCALPHVLAPLQSHRVDQMVGK
jgi:hypothetical protein